MKIHNDPQRSEAWFSRRRGIPTASQFDRIITPQGKPSGQAKKYMYELAYERLCKTLVQKDLSNIAHVQHGIVHEADAVRDFEKVTGLRTAPIGFITDDRESMGCSPDRVIVDLDIRWTAAVEIKCPTGPVHVGYLIDGLDNYKAQIQGQMMIGGFQSIHFYSWHPELPPYYKIVTQDLEFQILLSKYLDEFNAELRRGVTYVRSLGHWPSNAPSVFPDDPDDAA